MVLCRGFSTHRLTGLAAWWVLAIALLLTGSELTQGSLLREELASRWSGLQWSSWSLGTTGGRSGRTSTARFPITSTAPSRSTVSSFSSTPRPAGSAPSTSANLNSSFSRPAADTSSPSRTREQTSRIEANSEPTIRLQIRSPRPEPATSTLALSAPASSSKSSSASHAVESVSTSPGVSTPFHLQLTPSPSMSSVAPAGAVAHLEPTAHVNLGQGPYPRAELLTDGTATSWDQSPVVEQVFNGTPSPAERQTFAASVLDGVEDVYRRSGLEIDLVDRPGADVDHTLSVVSGTVNPDMPEAIGMAVVGGDGFTYVDNFAYAETPDELATAVAHNVAHELMHAFGVGEHPDQTQQYLDAAVLNWDTLADPNLTFSDEAIAALTEAGLDSVETGIILAQQLELEPTSVPEPTTWLIWAGAASGLWIAGRRRIARSRATNSRLVHYRS